MESFITAIVTLIQLALAGFVVWGGWLCLKGWFRHHRAPAAEPRQAAPAKVAGFERVASLVLLALLCTTLGAAG
jgi:hypothetical protein